MSSQRSSRGSRMRQAMLFVAFVAGACLHFIRPDSQIVLVISLLFVLALIFQITAWAMVRIETDGVSEGFYRRMYPHFPEIFRAPSELRARLMGRAYGEFTFHRMLLMFGVLAAVTVVASSLQVYVGYRETWPGVVIALPALVVAELLAPRLFRESIKRELWRFLDEYAVRTCRACGYDLRGAASPACSECGAETRRCVVCGRCITGEVPVMC